MKKPLQDKRRIYEFQAVLCLRELIRSDRAADAKRHREQAVAQASADRRALRLRGMISTAKARIELCKLYPTPLAVRQLRALVDDPSMPGYIRAQAAAQILEWAK